MQNTIDIKILDELQEIIGKDLKEILINFMQTSESTLQLIEQALTEQNPQNLLLHAHTLKGSSANIGAILLPKLTAHLESKGKDGISKNLNNEFKQIKEELTKVNDFLKLYAHKIN